MVALRVRGCLYLTCKGAIVRSHVYTADHEQDWQPYPVDPYSYWKEYFGVEAGTVIGNPLYYQEEEQRCVEL